jgi:hypothetical protein
MIKDSKAKIAWVLYTLLDETNNQLWNHYEKEFMRFIAEEEEEEIRAGEKLSEMDPDAPPEPNQA